MRASSADKYKAALQLLQAAGSDPVQAARVGPRVAAMFAELLADVEGRRSFTRTIVPESNPTVAITSGGVVTSSSPVNVKFPGSGGRCVGIMSVVAEGADYRPYCAAKIAVNGERNLFSNGQSAAFLNLGFFCTTQRDGWGFYPVDELVLPNDRWTVEYTVQRSAPASNATYTPLLAFMYDEDKG